MVLVKVCGITNLEDALAAAQAGADALGFNFYLRSPRYVAPETAGTIVDRLRGDYPALLTVGVFVTKSPEEIEKVAAVAGVSALQLHGNETPEYCKTLKSYFLIKAFSASDRFVPETVLDYDVQAIMIDAVAGDAFAARESLATGRLRGRHGKSFRSCFWLAVCLRRMCRGNQAGAAIRCRCLQPA